MAKKFTKTMVIGLVVVLVMSIGVVAVFAQDSTNPDTTPVVPFDRGFHCRGFGSNNDEALAESLGITVEELQAAEEQAAANRIAQAVEEGYLTQDQANTMLAMQSLKSYLNREEIMAQVLGLTVEELTEAKEAGTIRDLLANITPAELQESMQSAIESAIEEAVADNIITQDQADLVLEQIDSGIGMRGRFGRHQGFGKRGGFGGFSGSSQSGSFNPSVEAQSEPAFDV